MKLFNGRLRSSLIIGVQGIRARKLRTLLSMMSLFLGVLAVVVVQAGAESAERAAMSNVELTEGKDGTMQMFLPPEPKAFSVAIETMRGRPDAVLSSGMTAIIGEPGVTPLNPGAQPFDVPGGPQFPDSAGGFVQCDMKGCYKVPLPANEIKPPGQAIELRLTAMSGDIRQFRPFHQVAGNWLDFGSQPALAPRIVLNLEAAKGFSRYQVPAEMFIEGTSANTTPQIIGVIDDGLREPTAYVRLDEMMNWFPEAGPQGGGLHLMMSPAAAPDVVQILQKRLAATGFPAQDLHAEPVNSKERVGSQLALIRWIFLGMAALVLLIGVAGILNVGLATVGERIEEFALRRAVGTPRALLAGIVLAETMLTGLLTAAAAIGVAALGLRYVARFAGNPGPFVENLQFPWEAGMAGIIAGLAAGLLGGLIPAIRAARIPIATVMRA